MTRRQPRPRPIGLGRVGGDGLLFCAECYCYVDPDGWDREAGVCEACLPRAEWRRRYERRTVVFVGGPDPATDAALDTIRQQTLAVRPVRRGS